MGKMFNVSDEQITELCNINNNIMRVMRHITVSQSETEDQRYHKSMQKMVRLNKIQADKLTEKLDKISEENNTETERSIKSQIRSSEIKCTLNLDHAVKYLQKLITSTETDINGNLEDLITNGVQKALPAHTSSFSENAAGTSDSHATQSKNNNRGNTCSQESNNYQKLKKRKQQTYWNDCGDEGNLRGVSVCKEPSFETKKLKEEKAAKTSNGPDLTSAENSKPFFQKCSRTKTDK